MLDLVYEMMIMGRAPNCFDKYEYIKFDVMPYWLSWSTLDVDHW